MNAVQVTATSRPQFFVLDAFVDQEKLTIARRATAVLEPRVSFALSNCLLSLDLFRDMLRPILGGGLDVLCSGHGLRLKGLAFLDVVAVNANILQPGSTTYGDVLDAQIDAGTIIGTAMGRVAPFLDEAIRLGDLIYLDEGLRQTTIGSPVQDVDLNVADIVLGSAELLAKRVVDLKVDLDLGPLAGAEILLQVSDPRQIVLGAVPGDPDAIARTSQIRLHVNGVELAGLVEVDLTIDVANASARLSDQGAPCSTDRDQTVAVFSPVQADLLQVTVEARALGMTLWAVSDDMDEHGFRYDRVTRTMTFSHADLRDRQGKTFGPTTSGLTASLREDIRNLILGASSEILPGLVGDLLGRTFSNLDRSVALLGDPVDDLLTELVGLDLAEAELELLDVRCRFRLAI